VASTSTAALSPAHRPTGACHTPEFTVGCGDTGLVTQWWHDADAAGERHGARGVVGLDYSKIT